MQVMNKKDSLSAQLLRLLLAASFAAFVAFCGLTYGGECLIDEYMEKTNAIEKKNQDYIEKFQTYIDENQLSSRDVEQVNEWVKAQKILFICIYKDGIQVFNSEYPDQEVWEEEITAGNYEWEYYYNIEFADGTAEINMAGVYDYQLYNYVLIAAIFLSFLLFLTLVLYGIRRKIEYIRKLSEEVEILEGGGLDYSISVKGKDELTVLATGLEMMRLSFCDMIEQEKKMLRENQRIVTEMSHDLRTPITAIMLYTEILKKGTYKDIAQRNEYIEKIDKKARRMKRLADHLFEYSLTTGDADVKLEEAESYEALFYDMFSETCSYLEQKGFHIAFRVQWMERKVRISNDYMMRIMDNITSNIIKYADPSMPVVISSVEEENLAGFTFENRVRSAGTKVESTEIGIQSIINMMAGMGGRCRIENGDDSFRITLLFSAF